MTGTRTSTASADAGAGAARPAADRPARASCRSSTTRCSRASPSARPATRATSARRSSAVADVEVAAPARNRADIERSVRRVRGGGASTACSWSCSPTAPACASRRALSEHAAADLPGQHPARARRSRPSLGHGRPDLQPGRPRRAGHGQRDDARRACASTSSPTTGRPTSFRDAVEQLGARGARGHRVAVAAGGHLRLPDERDGRHPRGRGRAAARARAAGAPTSPRATCTASVEAVARDAIDAALAEEDERFEIDPALSDEEREDHIRMQIALERILRERGCTARTRRTSTRSPRTGASRACRWPRRRR